MKYQTDGWRDLADAIILKAVDDYRLTSKQIKEKPEDPMLQRQKVEIEKFFLSAWFGVLTDLNGKDLLHRLQAEMKNRESK